ncbi:hydroxylamine reductase [Plebeiibacterium marinum]|uniref:Hydroxylamine reductase n=1 Tax=Plebeiibacterium marinum TaxID=2992111 RepID=A0AAE3MDY5_9BACT|nr:hydroxylamine reductase [Plebeiobacterium marinum]MCW3805754.1 hydroxylamine reductase [Plebeiobacterium marinum]
MSMFCYQCQEAAKGTGCTIKGVCGKTDEVAALQDVLLFVTKGLAHVNTVAVDHNLENGKAYKFMIDALFITITNANFDGGKIVTKITEGIELRDQIKASLNKAGASVTSDDKSITYAGKSKDDFLKVAPAIGILSIENEDIRSLKELLTYGIKGMAAYAEHALNLGYESKEICQFIQKALVATTNNSLSGDELVGLVLECGKYGVDVMALLDKANTESYGNPEITSVNLGVRNNPAILISGHDLKDMEELLKQTEGTGVDVYTHSEMLPANYYPAFKKYEHFVGNYGNAWWKQKEEFESFNGPILFTTNCIVPPNDSYKNRVYTTGASGFDGCTHIANRVDGQPKDFSVIIEHAKKCAAPTEIETGEIVGGFAHNQVLQLADKVVDAVKGGAIKKFVVMAGCDGRMNSRNYYTDFANELPNDTVILTAGCAKYRYNKLPLGDIGGIPRVLDAGQCNDSYSLAVTALKLKEVFGLEDINDLPIVYNIAWYEQKAVIVLLALLSLGVKNINLGPTLPAFLSPNVANVLVENFGIGGISDVKSDIESMILS